MLFSEQALKDKVAIITGATRGLGRSIAKAYARAGGSVVITSRSQADCDRVAEHLTGLGGDVLPVSADVSDTGSINKLVDQVMSHFGKIDILVNNAGTTVTKKSEELAESDWDRVINTNLKGVFLCTRAVAVKMIPRKRGKIINIASVLGLTGERQVLPYCAAKGGVVQMTRALALEWSKYNIQVNSICPGYIRTSMNEAELSNEKIYNHVIGKIPMRRLGRPEDVTGVALLLASEASDYITGQMLVVDGGWTAG
ncbi:MAG: SDR family NAD(P)-dependent oxidoreductase [Bacillota bacterium]